MFMFAFFLAETKQMRPRNLCIVVQVASALTASIEVLLHAPYYTYDPRRIIRLFLSNMF